MRQFTMRVAEMAARPGYIQVRCAGAAPTFAPGQAGLAWAGLPGQPFGRVPVYPFHGPAGEFQFCLAGAGHPYAGLLPGAPLHVLGPCGHGFAVPPRLAHLLVLAASPARLFALIHLAVARRVAVTWLAPPGAPPPGLPEQVEWQRGALTPDLVDWADLLAVDWPGQETEIVRQVQAWRPGRARGSVQALVDVPMPCGTGACQACWTETPHGRRLACTEGPVIVW